ncbi:hypothetical protein A0H81_08089 [Grifola frondosa]|uniref:Fungal-type protein kinase domain-containing protein n=1 Tax=Grifola frondosa TaxID=5627 RepID=A0A1C7MA26_GRIFR|nr:hypothetical protein A0H81_08089 [Grifola frondosa]
MTKNNASQRVLDVPIALGSSDGETGGFDPKQAKGRNNRNVQDARKFILGPMPAGKFLDSFLPVSATSVRKPQRLSSWHAFNAVPSRGSKASEIYEPLLAALNKSTTYKSRCPGFTFDNTSSRNQYPKRLGFLKPDICCYATEHLDIARSSEIDSRSDLGYAALFIEIKPEPEQDFLCDPSPDAPDNSRDFHQFVLKIKDETTREQAAQALGQHVFYATELCARQHRTFCFSISMSGSRARFIRWDRAGAIATESFDIRDDPDPLCEFLWRFSQASDAERGYDMSVGVASKVEEKIFRDAIAARVRSQLEIDGEELAKAVEEHYKAGLVSIICVPCGDGIDSGMRRFIVSRPVKSPLWMIGRGTRGYWAVDAGNHDVVFLKDAWRSAEEGHDQEGIVLQTLNRLNVSSIPQLICHADVASPTVNGEDAGLQHTMTHEYLLEPWMCGLARRRTAVSHYIHYRLVSGPAGYGLKRFRGTNELLHASYDTFQAMLDAFAKDNRIHRDISLGNIILVREPGRPVRRGYLIDWEASCKIDANGRAVRKERMGTWQFMSYAILSDHEAPHTLQDDMESLFYVVLYCSIHWMPHNYPPRQRSRALSQIFDECISLSGHDLGGDAKHAIIMMRRHTRGITFSSAALQRWLNSTMDYRHAVNEPKLVPETWTDPKHLNHFWGHFLDTEVLNTDDRLFGNPLHDEELIDTSSTGKHGPSAISLGKRKRSESYEETRTPPTKRSRPVAFAMHQSKLKPPAAPPILSRKRKRVEFMSTPESSRHKPYCGPITRSRSRRQTQAEVGVQVGISGSGQRRSKPLHRKALTKTGARRAGTNRKAR